MSGDKMVFDLSSDIQGTPNIFVRKDWLNILDNQNQNYQNNQSVIDTSQLSNSNKWLNYREAYLLMPLLLSLRSDTQTTDTLGTAGNFAIGLKNWYGQMIHSFTLDFNGTTIVQQTNFCNMWNTFKLMTTMSWNDVITQGATIGFYPDDPSAFAFTAFGQHSLYGNGTANNFIGTGYTITQNGSVERYNKTNAGFTKRLTWINYNPAASIQQGASAYSSLQTVNSCGQLWKNYIITAQNGAVGTTNALLQIQIEAVIYLKHIHSFFNMCPLMKGVFMKMTMNLNNSSATIMNTIALNTTAQLDLVSSVVPVGGVQPIMISASVAGGCYDGGANGNYNYIADLSVGNKPLSQNFRSGGIGLAPTASNGSIYMYVPAYTFNPVFEQAYLSNPVKQIKFTDIYQYQVTAIPAGQVFSNLITNGIANIKSVLIMPFYSNTETVPGTNTGIGAAAVPVYQSPFDPAGTGTTSPLCHFTNFNIQFSGQNAIYNTQRYTFEQFNNQLYGQNAVNAGMTDGITSGLIDYQGFQLSQCFYYVNIERMLPVEQTVPKSIQILGNNLSAKIIDLWVFIEYGAEISIDVLTGARV